MIAWTRVSRGTARPSWWRCAGRRRATTRQALPTNNISLTVHDVEDGHETNSSLPDPNRPRCLDTYRDGQ